MSAKKVRGLQRHLRRFQQAARRPQPLSTARLAGCHYDYARVGLAPWVGMTYASNPPLSLQRAVVQGLLTTHAHWQAKLADYPEPFHLAIWVFELEFRESQVLVGIGERKARYERFFGEPLSPQPALPPLLSGTAGAERLHWAAYDNFLPAFYAADWPTPTSLARYLRGRRYFTEARPDGGTLYWLHRGLVWVGTAPLLP